MTHISSDDLRELLGTESRPCVSIFLPTFRAGAETLQNPIRLKNLLRVGLEKLGEAGTDAKKAARLLELAESLLDDNDFWLHPEEGLAVFRSPDLFRTYWLGRHFTELVVVNSKFYLKPLFPLLARDDHFYLLALSVNEVRLFLARQGWVSELNLGDAPRSLAQAVGFDITENTLRFHTITPAARARAGAPNYGGQAGGEAETKAEVHHFFERLDDGLEKLNLDRNAPMVLAGVGYLFPLFREASHWPNLVEGGVEGSPEGVRPEELRDRAWPLVEPWFTADRQKAAERFSELIGSGRASARPEDVLPAAHDGRIDALFTAQGARLPGVYDPYARTVEIHPNGDVGQDLLDEAAVQTFLHRGKVFAVPPEVVPAHGEPLAAVFRY